MSKQAVELTDLPLSVQPLAKRAIELRISNANMSQQIEQLGAAVDPATARLENFMDFLHDEGILTDEQLWTERVQWEESFRVQLQETLQVVREMAAERAQKARTPKLIVPGM